MKRLAIHTQVIVSAGFLHIFLILIGGTIVLLQFEPVRKVGLSLLASTGVAGVILGLAALRFVSNLPAGLQLAFFQSVKISDVVVVENEWGTVEEIGLTSVI